MEKAQSQQLLMGRVQQEAQELLRILLLPRGRCRRRGRSRRLLACMRSQPWVRTGHSRPTGFSRMKLVAIVNFQTRQL